jgi:hypothetical protein
LYTPALRIPDTGKKPTIRVTVPEKDVEVVDSDDKKIPTDRFLRSGMSKDAKLTVILRCTGIWIRGSKFGTSWKAVRILVHPLKQKQKPILKFLSPSPPKKKSTPIPPKSEDTQSQSSDCNM